MHKYHSMTLMGLVAYMGIWSLRPHFRFGFSIDFEPGVGPFIEIQTPMFGASLAILRKEKKEEAKMWCLFLHRS